MAFKVDGTTIIDDNRVLQNLDASMARQDTEIVTTGSGEFERVTSATFAPVDGVLRLKLEIMLYNCDNSY